MSKSHFLTHEWIILISALSSLFPFSPTQVSPERTTQLSLHYRVPQSNKYGTPVSSFSCQFSLWPVCRWWDRLACFILSRRCKVNALASWIIWHLKSLSIDISFHLNQLHHQCVGVHDTSQWQFLKSEIQQCHLTCVIQRKIIKQQPKTFP